ncbi:hypothetical protein [Campylobacter hyointestinalis]|uniref:hypothetical protein n=1 Tax=Campylobacter hyointestinalis TaxID=198 RepID=UPI0015E20DC4|nr:hypothetical protein [Campylobacter hyointestinalis]
MLRVVPGVVVPPTGSYTIVSPAIAFIAVRLKKMQKVLSSSTPPDIFRSIHSRSLM